MAWRRGGLRARLAGLLAALAIVGALGVLWLLAGGGADDAASPVHDIATPDRRDGDGSATGPGVESRQPGAPGPGSAEATGTRSAVDRALEPGGTPRSDGSGTFRPSGGTGTNGSSGPPTTTALSNRVESPSPSVPATTAPPQPAPPGGTTTTTTVPEAPPADDAGAGPGGLLGGLLDVLGVG